MEKIEINIAKEYDPKANAVVFHGNILDLLNQIPNNSIQLIVTSPPYNIGKEYEEQTSIEEYIDNQRKVIEKCVEKLKEGGHICWEVGNYIDKKNGSSEVYPLDIVLYPIFKKLGLKMRNRIVWHFEHGLHTTNRFSGRHETILWFTKGDDYNFDVDPIRVPQKYPGKLHYKGSKKGLPSGNPLGKNPGDVWIIPNVKSNHIEKTEHPCQFPIGLIERLVLSMTKEGDSVLDPFLGVGTTIIASVKNNRIGIGAELKDNYIEETYQRLNDLKEGLLKYRPRDKPVYKATKETKLTRSPF